MAFLGNMEGVALFTFIAMRMAGFVSLNPIWGGKNVSPLVKAGLAMVLTLHVFVFYSGQGLAVALTGPLVYMVELVKEFLVGFVVAYVMNVFFSVMISLGTIIDFNLGLSMATVFNPQTNASVTINSTIFHMFMIALFFASNCHLLLFRILLDSGNIVPYGGLTINPDITGAALGIFVRCIEMAVKLAFPVIAIEMLTETGVGVLMKMIPQIDVFIVNIQIKIMIGLLVILLMLSPMSEILSDLLLEMVGEARNLLNYL